MSFTFKGRGEKGGVLPVGLTEAQAYFEDLKGFLLKIEEVQEVRELGRPGAFLCINKPVGAMNFFITVAWAIQIDPTETGRVIRPLDFDTAKIKSEHLVLKALTEGELKLAASGSDKTDIDFWFSFALQFDDPPMVVKLAPAALVQATGDGLMGIRITTTVKNLYAKVEEDFKLPADWPTR